MKAIQKLLVAGAVASLCSIAVGGAQAAETRSYTAPAASFPSRRGCSMRNVTGRWLFATSIGRQMLPDFPADKDITALGTMIIKRDGSLSGSFDVAVEDTFFMPGIRYEGSVVINRDCTGTLSFVTELGSARTDSIALVGPGEFLGMSQDPFNLWTYQARRIGHVNRRDD